ncbi:hypothetical protein [Pseudoxanthomonas wuyuanensis]
MSKPIKHHPEPSGPARTVAADSRPVDALNSLAGLRNPAPIKGRQTSGKLAHH